MMTIRTIFISAVLALAFPLPGHADGIPIKDGRYSGGSSIIIELTESQRELIRTKYSPFFDFPLTDDQRDTIRTKLSVSPSPSKLMLVKVEDTAGECTCGAANLGLLIDSNRVEIPVKYVYTDEEAMKRRIETG
jgi:hypothetical protein